MAHFYLIRHAQPDYAPCSTRGYMGQGRDLAPLTEKGVQQAEAAAHDARLKDIKLIVSSPYTRALQTAAIISRITGAPLTIEVDLHEWIPDLTFRFSTGDEAVALCEDFNRCRGEYPAGETRRWETLTALRKRVRAVADKYAHMDGVALVSHGMALRTLRTMHDVGYAEIVELGYSPDMPDCVYWDE